MAAFVEWVTGEILPLDVFKITLAVLVRTNSLFWMPFFRGTFFEEKLQDFKVDALTREAILESLAKNSSNETSL